MNRLFVTAFFLLIANSALAQSAANPCWKTAISQPEMNRCASQDADQAESDLNRIYRNLLTKLKDDDNATSKLRAAQRAWLAFRDAHLEEVYPAEDKPLQYGSIYPMCYAQLTAKMTRERTAQLREILEGQDPCDLSAK